MPDGGTEGRNVLSTILPFRRRAVAGGWRQEDLAECFRIVDLLARSGLGVSFQTGASDEGDPWGVVLRADNGEVLIHIARMDGQFIVASAAGPAVQRGRNLRAVLDAALSAETASAIAARRHPEGLDVLRLHPAAVMASLIVTAWLHTESVREASPLVEGRGAADARGVRGATSAQDGPAPSGAAILKAATAFAAVAAALDGTTHNWTLIEIERDALTEAFAEVPSTPSKTTAPTTLAQATTSPAAEEPAAPSSPAGQDTASTASQPGDQTDNLSIRLADVPPPTVDSGLPLHFISASAMSTPWTSIAVATPLLAFDVSGDADADGIFTTSMASPAAAPPSPRPTSSTQAPSQPPSASVPASGAVHIASASSDRPPPSDASGLLAASRPGAAIEAQAVRPAQATRDQAAVPVAGANAHGGVAAGSTTDAALPHGAGPFYRGAVELLSLDKPTVLSLRTDSLSPAPNGTSGLVATSAVTTPSQVASTDVGRATGQAPSSGSPAPPDSPDSAASIPTTVAPVSPGDSAMPAPASSVLPATQASSSPASGQAAAGMSSYAAVGVAAGTVPGTPSSSSTTAMVEQPPAVAGNIAPMEVPVTSGVLVAKPPVVTVAAAPPRPTNGDLLLDFTTRDENILKVSAQTWTVLEKISTETVGASKILVFDAGWIAGRSFMLMPGVAMMEDDLLDADTRTKLDSSGDSLTLDLGNGVSIRLVGVLES